jgi:hypothetical protein
MKGYGKLLKNYCVLLCSGNWFGTVAFTFNKILR